MNVLIQCLPLSEGGENPAYYTATTHMVDGALEPSKLNTSVYLDGERI